MEWIQGPTFSDRCRVERNQHVVGRIIPTFITAKMQSYILLWQYGFYIFEVILMAINTHSMVCRECGKLSLERVIRSWNDRKKHTLGCEQLRCSCCNSLFIRQHGSRSMLFIGRELSEVCQA